MEHQTYILEQISKSKLVVGTSIRAVEDYIQPEIVGVCNYVGAGDVYTNLTRTGDGVVVGILEDGVIDTTHPDLQDSFIEVKSNLLNSLYIDEHTTQMAQIIAGSKGVAPDVLVLNALLLGTMTDEIEWMIENNVDIINISCGEEGNYGRYSSISAYIDYIMAEEYIIIVNSAGNRGDSDEYITNPGLAYNVLTIGSVTYGHYRSGFSSFRNIDGPEKPTISVYGEAIDLNDPEDSYLEGTSCSAAFMSGYLAWILQSHSSLIVNREKLYALLAATAFNPSTQLYNTDCGFNNAIGAGIFNYTNFEENYANSGMKSNSTGVRNQKVYTKEVYLQYGQTLRVSIATIASSDGTVGGVSFTDYDVHINNYNGALVAFAGSDNSVIEVVTYTAPASGYYSFDIVQISDRVKNKDYIGYAYRIY